MPYKDKEKGLALKRIYEANRRANATPEQKQRWLEQGRKHDKKRRANGRKRKHNPTVDTPRQRDYRSAGKGKQAYTDYNRSPRCKMLKFKRRSSKRAGRCIMGLVAFTLDKKVVAKRATTPRRPPLTVEEQRAAKRAYNNKRKAECVQHSIAHRLRNRILTALRNRRLGKKASTEEIIGCTWPEFIAHIESLFLPGMGWHNRRLWHLDHIRPLAAHDLTTLDGQKAAFHYLNTQPLWGQDNQSKGDRLGWAPSTSPPAKPCP